MYSLYNCLCIVFRVPGTRENRCASVSVHIFFLLRMSVCLNSYVSVRVCTCQCLSVGDCPRVCVCICVSVCWSACACSMNRLPDHKELLIHPTSVQLTDCNAKSAPLFANHPDATVNIRKASAYIGVAHK